MNTTEKRPLTEDESARLATLLAEWEAARARAAVAERSTIDSIRATARAAMAEAKQLVASIRAIMEPET